LASSRDREEGRSKRTFSRDREDARGKRRLSPRDRDGRRGKRREYSPQGDKNRKLEPGGIQGGIQVRIGISGERRVNDGDTRSIDTERRLGEGERSVKDRLGGEASVKERLGDTSVKVRLGNTETYKRLRQDSLDSPPRKSVKERLGVIPVKEKDHVQETSRGSKPRNNKGRSRSKSPRDVGERLEDLQRSLLKPMPKHLQNWTRTVNSKRDSRSLSLSPDPNEGEKKRRRRSGSSEKKKRRKSGDPQEESSKRSKKDKKKSKDKSKEDKRLVEENNGSSPQKDATPPRRRKNQRLTNEREYEDSDE